MIIKRLVCVFALLASAPVFAGTLIISGDAAVKQAPAASVAPGRASVAPVSEVVSAPAPNRIKAETIFSVARSDRTLREALVKWSRSAGWTFEPEHWAVARDIPVAGGASVDTDYKTAVRMLLRSTELTDLPVQPCFYNANQTLRVVPINDSCTRGN